MSNKKVLTSIQWRPTRALNSDDIGVQEELYEDLIAVLKSDEPLERELRDALAGALDRGRHSKKKPDIPPRGVRLKVEAHDGFFERRYRFWQTLRRLERGKAIHEAYQRKWSKAYQSVLANDPHVSPTNILQSGKTAREAYRVYLTARDENSIEAEALRGYAAEYGESYSLFIYAHRISELPDENIED